MSPVQKPAEGSWTAHYPDLGTQPMDYEDSISPEFYKLVWTDFPREESSGSCRQFVCKYHGWKYDLDGACAFVQQEQEFFDFDKADYSLVDVHCDVWAGFIFVNLSEEPSQTLTEFLGPMVTAMEGYPFDQQTERFFYRATVG